MREARFIRNRHGSADGGIHALFTISGREGAEGCSIAQSDLLVHDMGVGLSDGVSQGEAGPREFRTAPLWGLGQRIFFLHDGRTSDLIAAIRAHQSLGSEATIVVNKFVNLTETQKQNLLNFLRSL